MDLDRVIMSLSDAACDEAISLSAEYLSQFAGVSVSKLGNVQGLIKGKKDYTVLLDAHVDEIHFVVTNVDNKGFVKVDKAGGIDIRVLAGCEVTVWGNEPLYGVFCSVPPHLKKNKEENKALPVDEMAIDIGLSVDEAKLCVHPGDKVTFRTKAKKLLGSRIAGKSLDDRTGIAVLLRTAELISQCDNPPMCNVAFQFSQFEELGGMGAKTGSFGIEPDEAIAVDVGFGDNEGVNPPSGAKLGKGPMIGFSPLLSRAITEKEIKLCNENNIEYQPDVCGGRTFTNADTMLTVRSGIPCGLISIPLRSMHTPVEIVDVKDIEAIALILFKYVMDGGISND